MKNLWHTKLNGLLLAGVKPVSVKEALVHTGPDTFLYLDRYSIKKVHDGYKCCTCEYMHRKRAPVLDHIRMEHARKKSLSIFIT